ncbi:MAG: hemolysin family protein [Victivallaceae bacterium]
MDHEFLIIDIIIFVWLLSAWEAMFELSRGRVRRLETENKELARKLDRWLEKQNEFDIIFRFLTFLLIGLMATSLYENFAEILPKATFAAKAAWTTGALFAILVVSGILIRIMLRRLDIVILKMTLPLMLLMRYSLLWPVVAVIKVSERSSGNDNDDEKTSAEDEIMSLVEHDNEDGGGNSLEEDEKRMIRGIFDLDDTLVREIMTPRVDMVALPSSASITDAKRTFVESGHSRIPVYGNSIDEIKGILYAKDFLDESRDYSHLDDFSHKPLFVPETKNVGDLLEEFRKNSLHVAIIIDEYGGTSGIVTLEDILEEIVGDIRDEYDTDEDDDDEPMVMPDGSVIVDGRCLISDINDDFDLEIPEDEDVDTVGGYVCGEFGRIPEPGEEINVESVARFTVLKADKRKISTLKINRFKENNE